VRHTGNTMAARTGNSLRDLMTRMGHDNLRAASSQMLVVEHVVPEGGQFPHPQVRPDGFSCYVPCERVLRPPSASRRLLLLIYGDRTARDSAALSPTVLGVRPALAEHAREALFACGAGDRNRTRTVRLGMVTVCA
jgi:hypothetical protein